jgi:hypothetical protein
MGKHFSALSLSAICLCSFSYLVSCSKNDGGGTTPPADPCANKTITVTPTVSQNADPCANTGKVSVTASGSTGFTFKVDNGSYQSSGDFSDLSPGSHTFTAKDAGGCEKAASVSIPPLTAGTNFTAVKAVLQTNCAIPGCHVSGGQSPNWTDDCTIVRNADRIKARAVDAAGTLNQMPPTGSALPQADRDKINAWITAGKKFIN